MSGYVVLFYIRPKGCEAAACIVHIGVLCKFNSQTDEILNGWTKFQSRLHFRPIQALSAAQWLGTLRFELYLFLKVLSFSMGLVDL